MKNKTVCCSMNAHNVFKNVIHSYWFALNQVQYTKLFIKFLQEKNVKIIDDIRSVRNAQAR